VNFTVPSRGKVPETARSRQDRAEDACGGAANRCYVKLGAGAGSGGNMAVPLRPALVVLRIVFIIRTRRRLRRIPITTTNRKRTPLEPPHGGFFIAKQPDKKP